MRGAITVGDIHQSDEENIIFGNALIETYELESNIAIYPRIILSKSAYKFMQDKASNILKKYFRQSKDGIWFLHVFEKSLQLEESDWQNTSKPTLERMLEHNINNPEAFKKIRWFAEYYNTTIKNDVYSGRQVSKDSIIQLPAWP